MGSRPDLTNTLRLRLMSGSHLGLIRPGSRLPSVRELAREFEVDHRTILSAYRTLEAEGLVQLRARSGIYFDPSTSVRERSNLPRSARWALDVLLAALARGTPVPDVPRELARHTGTVPFRAACVECNDDQASALVSELVTDFGIDATGFNVEQLLADTQVVATLSKFDLIVTTPFHAGDVQKLAMRANVPWVAITYRADVFAEIARLLPTTPVNYVLIDPRFAAKLSRIYESSPGSDKLNLLRLGYDDIDAIPAGQPTFVSYSARKQLSGHAILKCCAPETRLCSMDSAREILTFIVHANSTLNRPATV